MPTPDRSGARVRALAAEAIDAVATGGRSLDTVLRDLEGKGLEGKSPKGKLSAADSALLKELSFGTLRHYYSIAAWRRGLLQRPVKKRDRIVHSLIDVGLYQLRYTRVPDHAAVSATVEAARSLERGAFAGLVNAVLRRFMREGRGEDGPAADEVRFDHPDWLIAKIRSDWPDTAEEILAANNDRAPMWLRVNRRKTTVPDYLQRLERAGIRFSLYAGLPDAVRLDVPVPVASLPGFADGDVSVQDGGAQIAARWLLADGGRRVLDACAAPGGKTAHLLEVAGDGTGTAVDAVDIDTERLGAVAANLARLGLSAALRTANAAELDSWWDGSPYDRILLDAPCSASGVIRRHPDIKLLRRASDIDALGRVQRQLLASLWQTLEPGGRLLYVTCSVLRAENDAVIEDFLAATPDAAISGLLPNNNIRALMRGNGPGYQLLPGSAGMDGFYFAALCKQTGKQSSRTSPTDGARQPA